MTGVGPGGTKVGPSHLQDTSQPGPGVGRDGTAPFRGGPTVPPAQGVPVPVPYPAAWETDQEAFDFEERAAIREYDGGLPRAAAERLASMDLINHRRRAA